ncbi:hypothetical protein [Streptomyces hokutonensis]|uniref:DUF8175 domain-containing protein n=1 Tax=Streptomyces hokutonensis TaxID=1306990 RepID=A0ABW6M5J7_9ACTN
MFKRRERRTEESGPYWKQRSWQLSAVFIALVFLLGGIAQLVSGRGGTGDGASGAVVSDGPLPDSSHNAKDSRPDGCRTDDSAGGTKPNAAPKDVSWRTLGVAQVPVSASAGPTLMEGPLWWCFAHTQTGAALAATVIPSQMSGSHWKAVTDRQVVAGAGRRIWEFERGTVKNIDSAADTDVAIATYVGFSVTSYTSTAAAVRLLLKSDSGYAATTIDLRWSGGDWKLLADGSGSLHSPVSSVSNTDGFIVWGV